MRSFGSWHSRMTQSSGFPSYYGPSGRAWRDYPNPYPSTLSLKPAFGSKICILSLHGIGNCDLFQMCLLTTYKLNSSRIAHCETESCGTNLGNNTCIYLKIFHLICVVLAWHCILIHLIQCNREAEVTPSCAAWESWSGGYQNTWLFQENEICHLRMLESIGLQNYSCQCAKFNSSLIASRRWWSTGGLKNAVNQCCEIS